MLFFSIHFQFQSPQSSKTDFQSINSIQTLDSTGTFVTPNDTTTTSTNSKDDALNKIFGCEPSADEFETESDDGASNLEYTVVNESNQIKLFLVISDTSIREKNVMTTRRINKWNIDMLESCERIRSDVIRIRFDTIKKDKKERTFRMEPKECQELDEYLRKILSKRPLSEMNQIVFRCINCGTHFSRERPVRNKNGEITQFNGCVHFYCS